jgi:hypothetical protein
MYASHIGKQLLQLYNEHQKQNLSAREFFEKEFFPVFYDHPRYLQWITNSPFVQGYRSNSPPDITARHEKLEILHNKVSTVAADGSFAIGFPAAELTATTSGQVSTLAIPVESEDIYCSWIGAGLGVGVKGGYVLYINHPEVLWSLFQGWQHYRNLLNDTPSLKPNQIDTWNGHWLHHAFSREFDPKRPTANRKDLIETQKDGSQLIPTIGWVHIIFALTRKFPLQDIMAYVFSLGQTNKTIGFIQLKLKEVKYLHDAYTIHFSTQGDIGIQKMEALYETALGFELACENGAIGIKTIEPKQLRDYMPTKLGKSKFPVYKNEEITITFNIYQSWLIAMLKNTSLLQLASRTAEIFYNYASATTNAKTTRANRIEKTLGATNRRLFIDGLTEIHKDEPSQDPLFDELVDVLDTLPVDNFPYFLTLIRFKYARLSA